MHIEFPKTYLEIQKDRRGNQESESKGWSLSLSIPLSLSIIFPYFIFPYMKRVWFCTKNLKKKKHIHSFINSLILFKNLFEGGRKLVSEKNKL